MHESSLCVRKHTKLMPSLTRLLHSKSFVLTDFSHFIFFNQRSIQINQAPHLMKRLFHLLSLPFCRIIGRVHFSRPTTTQMTPSLRSNIDTLVPIRGFCIGAPKPASVDNFVKFIKDELATRKVNTLILRVDFNYQFESHIQNYGTLLRSRKQMSRKL